MSAFQHELRVFTVQTATDPGLLTSFQAGTSKVVPSLATVTVNPVVVLMKVVACSACVIIL